MRLLEPVRIGPVVAPNRVVVCAHLTNLAVDGLPTGRLASYYGAMAAGGVGTVVTEELAVDPADRPYEKVIRGFDPAAEPGLRAVVDAIHAHGALAFAQLNHNGPQSSGLYTRLPVLAASAMPDAHFREVPKEADEADIAGVIRAFAAVARTAAATGFDGVEIQASQSSILRTFLSPLTNRREDRWGGDPYGRARLLLGVAAAVREAAGGDLAVGVRLCGDELTGGGLTVDDAVALGARVDRLGLADYLSTSVGVATETMDAVAPPMGVPSGYALGVASALRGAVGVPVVGVGRLTDAVDAERAVVDGHCDLVGMVRAHIADPALLAKARGARADPTRRCVGCNQGCVGRTSRNATIGCLVNPVAGASTTATAATTWATVRRRRRVVVVGAGPAGLAAAVAAAGHGHRVTVLERAERPGGQILVAAAAPRRGELGALVDDLAGAAHHLGVELLLGVAATAALVDDLSPDAVVVATGSRPERPPWAAADPRVVDGSEVVAGNAVAVGDVVVVDGTGTQRATSVAEAVALLAPATGTDGITTRVTVTTDAMVVGGDLDGTLDLGRWLVRAQRLGIHQLTDVAPVAMTPTGLSLLHHPTGRSLEVAADAVVLSLPFAARDELYLELQARAAGSRGRRRVERVGDCVAPRDAVAAVADGDRVGAQL